MLTDRVLQFARARLGAEPEHLWAKFPRYFVLRHNGNAKWFAVFLTVPRAKLGLDGGGEAEILVVKCNPILMGSLLNTPGILPAYHMSKANWITLLLDGALPEEELTSLLEISYELTRPKARPRSSSGPPAGG